MERCNPPYLSANSRKKSARIFAEQSVIAEIMPKYHLIILMGPWKNVAGRKIFP